MSPLPLRCVASFGVLLVVACIRDANLGDGETLEQGSDLDAMVAARCDRFFECDCSPLGLAWQDAADCTDTMQSLTAGWLAFADEHALALDQDCRQRWLDYYALPGCTPIDSDGYALQDAMLDCAIFHGDGGLGDACYAGGVFGPRVDTCATDLHCSTIAAEPGVCIKPAAEGQACGSIFAGEVGCALGLVCVEHEGDDGQAHCESIAQVGESCSDRLCDFDATCSGDVCEAVDVERPCESDAQCLRGYCDAESMTCKQPPAACGPYVPDLLDACDDAQFQTRQFQLLNQDCEVDEDCVALDASCALQTTCGQIAVNADYDATQWASLSAAMTSACDDECGADPCGFAPACNDGVCGFAM